MRRVYLVSYDISDPKRLRKVHKKLLGFGDRLQFSVFRCELSNREKVLLLSALTEIMNHREDSIMVADLGLSSGGDRLQFYGKHVSIAGRGTVIV